MNDMTTTDRCTRTDALLWAAAAAQTLAIGAAHMDLSRRTPAEIDGSKARWRLIALLPIGGPLWYFRRGPGAAGR